MWVLMYQFISLDWYLNFILLPLDELKLTRIKSWKHIKDLIAIIHEKCLEYRDAPLTIEIHSDPLHAPFRWQSFFENTFLENKKHEEKFVNKIDAYLWTIFKSERGRKREKKTNNKVLWHVSG